MFDRTGGIYTSQAFHSASDTLLPGRLGKLGFLGRCGATWRSMASDVISMVAILITLFRALITLLRATQEPPSKRTMAHKA